MNKNGLILWLSLSLILWFCVSVVESVIPPEYGLPQQQQQQQVDEGDGVSLFNQWSSTHPLDSPSKNLIDVSSISLALRLTCELNRRLQYSSSSTSTELVSNKKKPGMWGRTTDVHFNGGHQHSHEDQMINVHPSQTWNPPISRLSWQEQQEQYASSLTIFHATSPQPLKHNEVDNTKTNNHSGASSGVLRWGPDLEQFLKDILTSCFQITSPESQSTLLTFAMIYLDRACSVETLRSQYHPNNHDQQNSASSSCPYLTPRTVHRLLLTALTLAQRTLYHGTEQAEIRKCIQQNFGIAPAQLHTMEYLMLSALGDYGTDVHHDQYQQFTMLFQQTFQPNNDPTHDPSSSIPQGNTHQSQHLPSPPHHQYNHHHHPTVDNVHPTNNYEYV